MSEHNDTINPKSFYLSELENEKVFRDEVLLEAREDYDFSSKNNSTVFLSAGLPGAGKTNLINEEKLMMQGDSNLNVFIANSDEMRPYHPRYKEAVELFGAEAGSAVHHDAVIFSDKLIEYALQERANFIIDSTLRDPKKTEEIISKLQAENYNIKVSMLAVNEYESMHGILNRYAEQYKNDPITARFVDQRFIKVGKEAILISAEVIDNKNIQQFKILDREHNLLYDSTKYFEKTAKEIMLDSTKLSNFSAEKTGRLTTSWEELMLKLKTYDVPNSIYEKAEKIHSELQIELRNKEALNEKDVRDFKIEYKMGLTFNDVTNVLPLLTVDNKVEHDEYITEFKVFNKNNDLISKIFYDEKSQHYVFDPKYNHEVGYLVGDKLIAEYKENRVDDLVEKIEKDLSLSDINSSKIYNKVDYFFHLEKNDFIKITATDANQAHDIFKDKGYDSFKNIFTKDDAYSKFSRVNIKNNEAIGDDLNANLRRDNR